jgi:hypothetical protein
VRQAIAQADVRGNDPRLREMAKADNHHRGEDSTLALMFDMRQAKYPVVPVSDTGRRRSSVDFEVFCFPGNLVP